MSKRKYYPNNWKQVKAASLSCFEPMEFELFMDLKIAGYELPEGVMCLLRVRNLRTNKVSEYTYQQMSAAKRRTNKILDQGDSELTICTHTQVAHIDPTNLL